MICSAASLPPAATQGPDPSILRARQARGWRPGLKPALHSEIFASSDEAGGAALALALAHDGLLARDEERGASQDDHRDILWVQDRGAVRRTGRPFHHGLPASLRRRLIYVEAACCKDALFALEEGLHCRDLACVLGEITGNPREMDFTASRRLSLAVEKYGVPLWLVRLDADADLSSARMRWNARSAPSAPARWNRDAPGTPRWQAELFRARAYTQGEWIISDEEGTLTAARPPAFTREGGQKADAPDHGDLVGAIFGRSLAARQRA